MCQIPQTVDTDLVNLNTVAIDLEQQARQGERRTNQLELQQRTAVCQSRGKHTRQRSILLNIICYGTCLMSKLCITFV